MSMRLASSVEDAPGNGYVVEAPRASDVMSSTLREAYRAPLTDVDFGDLLRELDRIEIVRCRA